MTAQQACATRQRTPRARAQTKRARCCTLHAVWGE
jgi:hypothetical protein